MVKTLTSLIILPLLLFLEVGVGPLHDFLQKEGPPGGPSFTIGAVQTAPVPPNVCPVCRFLQISFLLSLVVFFSSFRRRCEKVSVREMPFPARPRKALASRGPPLY